LNGKAGNNVMFGAAVHDSLAYESGVFACERSAPYRTLKLILPPLHPQRSFLTIMQRHNQRSGMDIHFYEAFEDEAKILKSLLGDDFTYAFAPETIQEAGHVTAQARLVSIRTQSIIPSEWAGQIDGVLSRSTGFDHLKALSVKIDRRIPLGFLEEYATRAVAEHAILLTMALIRRLPQQIRQFPAFNRENLTGAECEGKNLLVVGVGRIGSEIFKIARALGFVVKGVDIVPDKPDVSYVTRDEGIRWADVIICAMNLTDQNRGYFNERLLGQARKGLIFVNIARGELSPLNDLEQSLREGSIAGLGLDVFEDENLLGAAMRNPGAEMTGRAAQIARMLALPNVLFTPHNAFNSSEALRRKSELTVQQIRHFFQHGDFLWKV
jgi:D-lactate dehydrogenase